MADSWFPKHSETEIRRATAETFYELEMEARRQGYLEAPRELGARHLARLQELQDGQQPSRRTVHPASSPVARKTSAKPVIGPSMSHYARIINGILKTEAMLREVLP